MASWWQSSVRSVFQNPSLYQMTPAASQLCLRFQPNLSPSMVVESRPMRTAPKNFMTLKSMKDQRLVLYQKTRMGLPASRVSMQHANLMSFLNSTTQVVAISAFKVVHMPFLAEKRPWGRNSGTRRPTTSYTWLEE
jgi:hypothetical protein